MPYNNNVPLINQTIAASQPIINNNFMFIQSDLQVEHQFNGNVAGQLEGTHLKASMPNMALFSGALPAGCNGSYYVSSGNSFFYDGTRNWQLNGFQGVLLGANWNATSSYTNIIAVPAHTLGIILLQNNTTGRLAGQMGCYISDGSTCSAFATGMVINGQSGDRYVAELNNSNGALFIQGRTISSSYNNPYNVKVFYRPT